MSLSLKLAVEREIATISMFICLMSSIQHSDFRAITLHWPTKIRNLYGSAKQLHMRLDAAGRVTALPSGRYCQCPSRCLVSDESLVYLDIADISWCASYTCRC